MICNQCGERWANLPPNWPYEMLTKDEESDRVGEYRSDKVRCCPKCIDASNFRMDYLKSDMYEENK